MQQLLISFEHQNGYFGRGSMLFRRRQPLRFEFAALLAFRRAKASGEQAWVTLEDVARLPSWKGKRRHHVSTNVGRYLQQPTLNRIVEARTAWAGPYRLRVDRLAIGFDLSFEEVRKRLQLRSTDTSLKEGGTFIRFTREYARAQWLFSQGKLFRRDEKNGKTDDAHGRLMRMADDRTYGPNLRLLALLAAADVLYRLGRFRAARISLQGNEALLRQTSDLSLKARYYLSLAWAYQRSATGRQSDRAVEKALAEASAYAENSGDRMALALLGYRRGGYLTKKQRHYEAVDAYLEALESYLMTGNYYGVQSTCCDIGSVIHRLGPDHYTEARRWLALSIRVARLMNIGREDAHAEMILGKIYVELNKPQLSKLMLTRAERIASEAHNRVNHADTKMVWGFWYQRYGTEVEEIATLVEALRLFKGMSEFDVPQKENYMRERFPEVWAEVLKRTSRPE